MKTIRVVAAIMEKNDKILIAKRLKGDFKDLWEFPGGKYEDGETGEQAIVREIEEEFEVKINVHSYLTTVEYQYPNFYLIMDCYICTLCSEAIHLNDHSAIRWIHPSDPNIEWVPADIQVIKEYRKRKNV